MGRYEEITKARKILGLDEYATLKEIKNKYRALLKEWHPDLHKKEKAVRKEKTIEIIDAYKTIMDYCEQYRFSLILRPDGKIIIGMLDKESPLGKLYETKKNESKFYKFARFYSVKQVLEYLGMSGYAHSRTLQTIFRNPEAMTAIEPVKEGYSEGLFVVISADKSNK